MDHRQYTRASRRFFRSIRRLIFLLLGVLLVQCQSRTSSGGQDTGAEEPVASPAEVETYNQTDMMTKDVLIIVGDAAGEEAKQKVSALPLRQEISERVRIVNIDAAQAADMIQLEGIYLIEGKTLPPDMKVTLTTGEQMFVDGWLARIPESEKQRAGEGLKWDDPNFQPPDSLKKN